MDIKSQEVLNRLKKNEEKNRDKDRRRSFVFWVIIAAIIVGIVGFFVWASMQEKVIINITMIYGESFESEAISVEEGGEIKLNTIPEWEGYDIKGWYLEDTFETRVDITEVENIEITTLYAKWGLEEYEIKYYLSDGGLENDNPTKYTMETETFSLLDPTARAGFIFEGWFKSTAYIHEVTEITNGTMEDIKFFAKWDATTYTIIYNHNGVGTMTMPVGTFYGYTARYEDFTLLAPEPIDGYIFGGWFEDSECLIPADTYIEKWSTENITVYAKWIEN